MTGTKSSASSDETLYFLVRKGTNIRAVTPDKQPVMVTIEAAEKACAFYERLVALYELGRMEPISVDDYFRRYIGPQVRAQETVEERLKTEVVRGA